MSSAVPKKNVGVRVPGFLFGSLSCGIKKSRKDDIALIFSEKPATAAALFTTNRLKAAPVAIGMERIKKRDLSGAFDKQRTRKRDDRKRR